MGVRVGILFFLVLGARWACADARRLVISDLSVADLVISQASVIQINYQVSKKGIQSSEAVARNINVCTYCKEFTAQALYYLGQNMTQTEIIDILDLTCSLLHPFEHQCITLVDYYGPLFFSEIATIQPKDFCQKVNLCSQVEIASPPQYQNSCGFCHRAVSEVLVKLKDPDVQLEITKLLLKGCHAVENYAKQCKKWVFEYAPLIMSNAEQFLETTDLCTTLHACKASTADGSEQASSLVKMSTLSES